MAKMFFQYTNNYDFSEFSMMCDAFSKCKLPFLKKYQTEHLVSSYIYNYSLKRIPIGPRNTLKRFLGSLFDSSISVEGKGKKALIYTGGETKREDYLHQVNSLHSLWKDSMLVKYGFSKRHIFPCRLFDFGIILIWAFVFNKLVHSFNISLDMSICIYRNFKTAQRIYKIIRSENVNKLIVYCDAWGIDNFIVQKSNFDGIKTATLQHGNGTDIMYSVNSSYFLCNSVLSKNNLVKCKVELGKIYVCGPLKYLGRKFDYKSQFSLNNIGIVFDGGNNYKNNIEMLNVIHKTFALENFKFIIRLHPNNKLIDYKQHFTETDIIESDLEKFESNIDLCIVYNSSMFSDLIYRHIPVIRFYNGNIDLYQGIKDQHFTDTDSLKLLIEQAKIDYTSFIAKQKETYNQIFGAECSSESYLSFLNNVFYD